MALRMPGVIFIDGIAYLNVRVPTDLADRVRGTRVTLPVDGRDVEIKITDKVSISLRTKDRKTAHKRGKLASAVLDAHWDSIRLGSPAPVHGDRAGSPDVPIAPPAANTSHDNGVPSLTLKQIVALAGEAYRDMVGNGREDTPPDFNVGAQEHAHAIEAWRVGDPGDSMDKVALAESDARFLADLQLPYGPQLLAWRNGADLSNAYVSITYDQAMEDLFGARANAICSRHRLRLDATTRRKLLEQIGQAELYGAARLKQTASGDFSPDVHIARFPKFDAEAKVSIATLFERWRASKTGKVETSTIRRYTPSLMSLAAFLGDKDIRSVDQDDIWAWAEHRRDVDRIASGTVNRNDLVAAASVFTFATTRDGRRLRPDNPVAGVRLELPKIKRERPPFFRPKEVAAILNLARSVTIAGAYPKAAASRRWAPWICAYSGSRIQEPLWLAKDDVEQDVETGIWTMTFRQTKTGNARTVPLHDALIDEGFLSFVQAAPNGLLFVGDRPRKVINVERTIQEQRASQIAEWIQHHLELSDGVDPNHGWRHSFITRATGRMEERIQHAICGHNEKRDVADGYFTATISEMKAGLDRFPRYTL